MHRIRNWLDSFSPLTRRVFLTIGIITLVFLGFSLATISDLLAPVGVQEVIVNAVPLVLSLIGCVATYLALRNKVRLASYIMIGAIFVGFLLIPIYSPQPVYSTIAELIIVVIPVTIAVQSLSEREFTWTIVASIIARSIIQILAIYKTNNAPFGASAQTAQIAQWASVIITIGFIIYLAFNLNNYAFRVKMILVLGFLTIVPTAIISSINSGDLQKNLINQANQNLVSSSSQLASAVEANIKTVLDMARVEAQIPGLEEYIGQPSVSGQSGDRIFARGTDLEKTTMYTLRAILKKDPIYIKAVRLFDRQGTLQLSTDINEIGEFHAGDKYYLEPYQTGYPYMSSVIYSEKGDRIIHFGAPIRTSAGITNGVLDIVYSASFLQQILVHNGETLGQDVTAMLLDDNNIVLAHIAEPTLVSKIINPIDSTTVTKLIYDKRLKDLAPDKLTIYMGGLTAGLQNISKTQYFSGNFAPQTAQTAGSMSYSDQAGASELTSLNWYVVTFVPQSTLLAPVRQQTQSVVLISILISLISIVIALGLTQILISPILSLTRTSEKITQGDINATATVRTQDEVGILASTFNAMTGRVRDLIGSLEQRVAERTKALERRAVQLQAAGDVGSTAARLRDLNELLRQTTRLISQRFGFYHVGIFLIDDLGEFAVLKASNSEGGLRMLNRQHKLKVGQVGIVGFVTGTGQPRIALNVGQDVEYFNNPDLPLTQSEMALPLIAGGKILGALDIQSTETAAFTEDDVNTLKVLADQIAVAIENARLFSENQAALETARRAYGELSTQGWQQLLQDKQANIGYISLAEERVAPVSGDASPEFKQAIESGQVVLSEQDKTLYLPIKIRGQCVGAFRMEKNRNSGKWIQEDVTMATTLAEQIGTALESARLYADTRQRAEREYIISDIASKIGASIQIDTILRTSVAELGRVLEGSEISIQMGPQTQRGNGHE